MAEEEQKSAGDAQPEEDAVKKKGDSAPSGGLNPKLVYGVLVLNSLVIIVVAVLIAMSYMRQSKTVSLADIQESKDHSASDEHGAAKEGGGHGEAPKGGDGHGGGDKKAEDPAKLFITENFTVNLSDSKGSHFAKVDVVIEAGDDSVRGEIERILPKIRDFIVVVLSSKTYDQVASVDGREFLREEIRNKINGYLTRGQIKDVYFTQFIVQ